MTDIDNTILISIQEDLDRLVNNLSIHFDIGIVDFEDPDDYERLHAFRTQLERYVLADFESVSSRFFKLVYPIKQEQFENS